MYSNWYSLGQINTKNEKSSVRYYVRKSEATYKRNVVRDESKIESVGF